MQMVVLIVAIFVPLLVLASLFAAQPAPACPWGSPVRVSCGQRKQPLVLPPWHQHKKHRCQQHLLAEVGRFKFRGNLQMEFQLIAVR